MQGFFQVNFVKTSDVNRQFFDPNVHSFCKHCGAIVIIALVTLDMSSLYGLTATRNQRVDSANTFKIRQQPLVNRSSAI
jgi:hypothetical protein